MYYKILNKQYNFVVSESNYVNYLDTHPAFIKSNSIVTHCGDKIIITVFDDETKILLHLLCSDLKKYSKKFKIKFAKWDHTSRQSEVIRHTDGYTGYHSSKDKKLKQTDTYHIHKSPQNIKYDFAYLVKVYDSNMSKQEYLDRLGMLNTRGEHYQNHEFYDEHYYLNEDNIVSSLNWYFLSNEA